MEKRERVTAKVYFKYSIGDIVTHRLYPEQLGIITNIRILLRGSVVDYEVTFDEYVDWYSEHEIEPEYMQNDELDIYAQSDEEEIDELSYFVNFGKIAEA